jgi:hypothetical protein
MSSYSIVGLLSFDEFLQRAYSLSTPAIFDPLVMTRGAGTFLSSSVVLALTLFPAPRSKVRA